MKCMMGCIEGKIREKGRPYFVELGEKQITEQQRLDEDGQPERDLNCGITQVSRFIYQILGGAEYDVKDNGDRERAI